MRIRLTLHRANGVTSNLSVTADASSSVGDIAQALYGADPAHAGLAVPAALTLRILDSGGTGARLLRPESNLHESSLRSGSTVELAPVSEQFALPGNDRGEVAALLRITGGPDAGREFPLPFGSSSIGRDRDVDVRLSDPLVSKRHARVNVADTIEVIDWNSANGIVLGGQQVQRAQLTAGDDFVLGDTHASIVPVQRHGAVQPAPGAIEFVRTPRVVDRFPGREFVAPTPPQRPQPNRLPILAIVAPLIVGAVLFALTQQVLAVVFVALSPLLVVGSYIDNKLAAKRLAKVAAAQFDAALASVRSALEQSQVHERAVRSAESPSVLDTVDAVERLGPLLWTHRSEHTAFLTLRLGTGEALSRNSVKIPDSNDTLPELWSRVQDLAGEFATVADVPHVADLRTSGALGLAGPRSLLDGVARGIALQVAGLHSPAEAVIAVFASPHSRAVWDWVEWLPHTASPSSPLADQHLADNAASGGILLARIEAIIDARTAGATGPRGPLDREKEPDVVAPIIPAIVVIIENDAPVDRGRLTRLAERGADASVHVVWCAPEVDQLPAVCRTFLRVDSVDGGGAAGEVRFGERAFPLRCESVDLTTAHRLARALAPVIDIGSPTDDDSDLPRAVSYADLLGRELVTRPSAVVERWRENNSLTPRDGSPPIVRKKEGNLRALVGHTGAQPFYLDIRSQGPHALVGGTTGAGKSEFLQAWVLGMAAAHSPDRVTFLFVDYKGGSAFADCVALPHFVGLVTDLTPHLVRRALTSLRAELHYREHLLNRKKAKDLVSLEKKGDPEAPPSLLIVVDEFAALAQEVPEFVDGVVDIAQRGRSLGLHLILATQRPAGVIKGSLRSNTNLRIALRMADGDDSTDILGTPLAAEFDPSIPGRGAAKSGPGRMTPFQTGYAGGWTTDTPTRPRIDIEEMAFGSGQPWEVPEPPTVEIAEPGPTDIARIVATVKAAAQEAGVPSPRKPWLEELAPSYDLTKLPHARTDERLVLGVLDDARSQTQPVAFYEPDRDGNMAIYGAGGSGKSSTLRSIAIAATATDRGGPIRVYGLDFAGNGLKMVEVLPHVGAIISGDDDERVVRLLRTLRDIVDERSVRYTAASAATIGEYRTNANAPGEPRILLLVDGVGAFRDAYEYSGASPWFTVFSQIAVDGRGVGVHIVVTGDRPNAIPTSLASTIQRRLVLRLASEDDYTMLGVEKDILGPMSPPGRGVLDGVEVQVAVVGGSSNLAVQARGVQRRSDAMRRGGVPDAPGIGTLADQLWLRDLPAEQAGWPVIGVGDESLSPVAIEPRGAFLVSGPPGSGRTTTLATIAAALRRTGGIQTVLFSARKSALANQPLWHRTSEGLAEGAELARTILAEIEAGRFTAGQLAIVVEGLPEFNGGMAEVDLDTLLRRAIREDMFVVAEGETSTWKDAWTLAPPLKAGGRGLLLTPGESDGDSLLNTNLGRIRRADFPPGRGMLVGKGRAAKIQVAVDVG